MIGIREKSQLFSHPLVGGLFENMVVMEAVKYRKNRGLEPDLWFYRNSSGTIEVDLLVEDSCRLHPVEIKSSSTYSDRMGKRLKAFCDMVANAASPIVVYSGQTFDNLAVNFAEVDTWMK